MTRILYIHAGPPKTGTSAIQRFFRDNAEILARNGLYWPRTGTERVSFNHMALSQAFRPGQEQPALLDQLARELAGHDNPERVLVSVEHFAAQLSNPGYLANLEDFALKLGYGLHIIAYIRPQVPLLNSLYAQNVKNWRNVPEMDHYVDRELRSGRHDYVEHFARLLNSDSIRVTLRPFNAACHARGITTDICDVIGLPAGLTDQLAPAGQFNVVPGPRTVAAFRRIRHRAYQNFPDLDRSLLAGLTAPLLRIADAQGWNAERFGGFPPGLQAKLEQRLAESNDRLSRLVWSRPWNEIFSAGDCKPPPYNVFDPALAAPEERKSFRDFVNQSLDAIGDLAVSG